MMNDTESTGTKCENAFKINQVVFDNENKEYVSIANGVENAVGEFVPTEAIVMRVVGFTDTGKPVLAFTYRKIDASKLSPLVAYEESGRPPCIQIYFDKKPTHFCFAGRV